MTTPRIAQAASLAAVAALLLLPWHQGKGAHPLVTLGAAQPLLWPGAAALLAAAAVAVLRPHAGRALLLCARLALALLLLQGLAIGLPATTWGIARDIFGPEAGQAAFGPAAAASLAAATVLLAIGFARSGGFRGDGAVALIAVCGAGALTLFVFLPILRVMRDAFVEDGRLSPGVAVARLAAPEAWSLACLAGGRGCGVVWNTLLLATLTGALSTVVGLSLAVLETRGGLRRTGAFRAMAVLPLITPPFVVSLSLIVLFGRTGIVTTLLWDAFDIPRTRWIYGLPGVLIAQCLSQVPIAFLLLYSALRAIAPSLEEAAGTMGARPATVFATVTLPLLRPRVLLFDEPLSNLDARLRRRVRGDIRDLQRQLNLTVVYVTHDQQEALAVSDTVVVMREGRIAQMGPPRALYEAPQDGFIADFMGEANVVEAEVVPGAGAEAVLRFPGGSIAAPLSRPAEGRTQLAVRPAAIALAPPGGDGLAGSVRRAGFVGNHMEYEVTTPAGELFLIGPADGETHRAGDPVTVCFRRAIPLG